ncbi:hypothetical protein [Streptomyces sp. NPDC047725]|uniref:hypothetical protein n=1 Tax=Streptomyces sp. NPDC047725 TaxID=3365487 RepID=UPI003719F30C
MAAPLWSDDHRVLMVEVALEGEERDAKDKRGALPARIARVGEAHPGLLLEETGNPSVSKGVDEQRGEDLAPSDRWSRLRPVDYAARP